MKKLYSILFLCFLSLVTRAQLTTTYTTNNTWTVPAGVTSITVKVYGGAGGTGGQDCGAGCGFAAAGTVGYVLATYTVAPGNIIGIYPGTKGGDAASAATNSGGGAAGVNSFNTTFNGGTGGNAGTTGTSGGGGGGGAASIVTIAGVTRIVAGGAGGGGGMANSANSGKAGSNTTSANGTSNTGQNGFQPSGDGGGSGAGGGGLYGSVAGTLYAVGAEQAGNGGFRGNNSVTGATTITTNADATWTATGQIEITYTPVGGTAAAAQTICSGTSPANLTLTGYAGTIQWQNYVLGSWSNISGATSATLTSAQMGMLFGDRDYRAYVSGMVYSNTITITVAANAPGAAVTPSGAGTVGSPYLISTIQHLRWVSENSSSWGLYFRQTASIDAGGFNQSCYNSGTGWNPIGNATTAFTGNYDGGSFAISNLYINRAATANLGFFGVSSGTIQNLSLTAASISTTSPVANTNMGILAGQSSGTITGCTVSGTVSGGTNYVGGLVGSSSATITNSSSSATVSGASYIGGIAGRVTGGSLNAVYATGNITASVGYAGGITGELNNASINNSYAWGAVSGPNRAGGAIGSKAGTGTVTNIYSTGVVTGTTNTGGLIGELVSGSSNAINSFWDTQTSGRATSAGGATGKTTAEMKTWDTFYSAAWDLQCESGNGTTNPWGINSASNNGYPFVSWQPFSTVCPTWNGTTDNNFNVGSNWSGGVAPSTGMDVTFSPTATNDLVISQNTTVGSINFNGSNRKLRLGTYDLTITGTVSGANATNYIQTNSTGTVKRNIATNASFTFPVGNSSYNPATVTNRNATADVFSARIGDEVYQNGSGSGPTVAANRVRRTWYISKQNANAAPGFDMVLNYNAGEVSSPMAAPGLANSNGTNWYAPSGGATSTTTTSLTFTGYVGGLVPFSIQESAALLPVTLQNFTATKQVSSALLDWSTANESNSAAFEIEHSVDGNNWYKIGTVAAAGNSAQVKHYSFVHNSPVAGLNFYRLLQRDLDRRYTYSKTVSVQFDTQKRMITLFPNPVTGQTVNVVLRETKIVRIVNSLGVVMVQKRLAAGTNQVSVKSLPKGMYVLIAEDEHIAFVVQ